MTPEEEFKEKMKVEELKTVATVLGILLIAAICLLATVVAGA